MIITYNDLNAETARYGSGYYYLEKGKEYTINGKTITFSNDYVINYSTNYLIGLNNFKNWNVNSTLAYSHGLVLNLDPTNLSEGTWKNQSTGLTYEQELASANAKTDEEEKNSALAIVRSNFYNYIVPNGTESGKDTGIQKTGDVVYDKSSKALKFNENIDNTGYLKITKADNGGSIDFSKRV